MKKRLCVLLACCLMLSMFAACGGNGGSADATTPKETTVVDGKTMVGNMFVEGDQIVKEPVTLKIMSSWDTRQSNFEEMDIFKDLEAKSNVKIEWELIPSADWTQKKNLKLASGTLPDAFFIGMDDDDVTKYAPVGMLIPLDDLIDQYAPNLKKVFEAHPEYEAGCRATDGKIYSLPNLIVDPGAYNPDQMFINKTWLDKLGLEVPTTMEEFHDVLMAFKTQDPNGNGKPDEIPFSARFDNYIQGYHSLFGAFGRCDMGGRGLFSHFVIEDGKLVFTADKEEYRTAITELHKFFEEGLFDEEIFTQDVKQYFAKGKTEEMTLGCFMLWNRGNMVGPERVDDYVPVAPMKGTADPVWMYEVSGNTPNTAFAVTNACENPEIMIRWIDQFYDERIGATAAWGPTVPTENGPAPYEERDADQSFDDFRYANSPIFGPLCVTEDFYGRIINMPDSMVEKYDIMKEVYEPYLKNESMPSLKFTQEEADWMTANGVDINNFINDHQARWMLEGGIEEEWDSYIEGLKALNIDKHVEIMTAAYERYVQG